MLSRRNFCGCALGAAITLAARAAHAGPAECAVLTPALQQAINPDAAIARLMAGNERFISGKSVHCDLMAQVHATAQRQAPFAAIVGCIDSRVPPELVFDQKIGDIFCARVAGNFINTDIIGSLEFATKLAGAQTVMVLGHSECGAVKGAIDGVKLGKLTSLLANIQPAVAATSTAGERNAKNREFVQAVAENNTRMAAAMLASGSDVLRQLVQAGQLRIVAAMHDVASGRVHLLS